MDLKGLKLLTADLVKTMMESLLLFYLTVLVHFLNDMWHQVESVWLKLFITVAGIIEPTVAS